MCFPNAGTTVYDTVGNENGLEFQAADIESVVPSIRRLAEQQKFLIAWTLCIFRLKSSVGLMLAIWERGQHADPGFENRIEFHYPAGRQYIAKTYGTEEIFGKTVQKGIAARMLEYANDLLVRAYEVTDGPDLNDDGTPIGTSLSSAMTALRWLSMTAAFSPRTLAAQTVISAVPAVRTGLYRAR